MLLQCPTPDAVLLCALPDALGVLRVPVDAAATAGGTPGLRFTVAALTPINIQLADAASAFFGQNVGLQLHIEQEFADQIGSGQATLYLARLAPAAGIVAPSTWLSIPTLLRQLAGRERLPYLRAWQVLAGGLQLATKAVEAAEVMKYFDEPPEGLS